jgi:hypothetical protein
MHDENNFLLEQPQYPLQFDPRLSPSLLAPLASHRKPRRNNLILGATNGASMVMSTTTRPYDATNDPEHLTLVACTLTCILA